MTLRAYLDAVEQRAQAATPGPWDWFNDDTVLLSVPEPGGEDAFPHVLGGEGNLYLEQGDAAFIAQARTDLPRLVALLRRAVEALEWVDDHCPCGARMKSSPHSHPHVGGCPIEQALADLGVEGEK